MKKKLICLFLVAMGATNLFAGGILTNTNQSVAFVRTMSRNASTDIDAIYFNPAATVKLSDGFNLSFNWQMPIQTRTTTCDLPYLNQKEYKGEIFVPFYPTLLMSWKREKLALSFNFAPIGGGGSAEYKSGLASFERQIAVLPLALSKNGIPTTKYDVDIQFEGGSIMYAGQLGAAYAITDKLSASVGVRLTYVKNNYKGYIRNIQINPTYPAMGLDGTKMMSAPMFFTQVAEAAGQAAQAYETAGDAQTAAQYKVTQMTMKGYAASTAGMEVDASQSGLGVAPIIGVNFQATDKLNLAARFEFNTKVELTNESGEGLDGNGMFKNDSTFRKDVPGILAIGAEYKFCDKFRASLSYTYYLDKQANWEGREKLLDHNMYELAGGIEYDINNMFTVSCGYQRGFTGATEEYQTDMDFSLNTNTYGIGGRVNFTDNLNIDFGYMLSVYEKATANRTDAATGMKYKETFDKVNNTFALGINYRF